MIKAKHTTDKRDYIPQKWTLRDGSQTGNFPDMPEATHNSEGWIWCAPDPVITDQATQKLGSQEIVNGRWVRVVVDKTAEEITEYQAQVAAQKFAEFQGAIQKYLDNTARLSGYDDIVNACGYAAAPNPFQAESLAFVVWRGNVWAYSYQMLADVESGARTEPTIDEVINELPKFNQG